MTAANIHGAAVSTNSLAAPISIPTDQVGFVLEEQLIGTLNAPEISEAIFGFDGPLPLTVTVNGGTPSVPEPSSFAVLALAGMMITTKRRRLA